MADPDVVDFYQNRYDEADRLTRSSHSVEFLRTVDVLSRVLPPRPGRVLDVGGGAGVYAEWLAARGNDVTLVDPVERHVLAASKLSPDSGSISAELGDALNIKALDNTFDAVLMLGPLYHLTERQDRVAAWTEAGRVCRPGGVIVAAMISRFASFRDMLLSDQLGDGSVVDLVAADLESGQHRNPGTVAGLFTTAYFHHPEEIMREAAASGVEVDRIIGVEGLAAVAPDIEAQLEDDAKRQRILDLLRRTEEESSVIGISSHILATATA